MFAPRLGAAQQAVAARLDEALAALPEGTLRDAMRHATAGGKRLRAFLAIESAALYGVTETRALQAAAAVEAIHAYSLVHDDLPAMDDDALRRGRPTVHVVWDEATAILAGDALQSLAFALLAEEATHPDAAVRVRLIAGLARAAGGGGMVLGQARDIAAEQGERPLALEGITEMQAGKTGALIEWAATAGAHLAGADPAPLAGYARALGLAFQIADDLLDETGEAARTGKRVGKDRAAGKATFVSLLGPEAARARAEALVAEAEAALFPHGRRADVLREAARFAIARES